MTRRVRTSVEPAPTIEEAAAIVAALEVLADRAPKDGSSLKRSRWRLAGLLGHQVPAGMELEGSLWSYASWEDMV